MSLVLEFVSCVVKNLVGVSEEAMDYWVKNPKALQEALTKAFSKQDTFIPKGWKVKSHKQDAFQADPSKITLYLSEGQKGGGYVQGFKLQKELEDQPVLNANTLDYYLAHPDLIPEDWKGKAVFFWGTVYNDPGGRLYVRYLYWDGGRWGWYPYWLGNDFRCYNPAACSQV